MSNTNMTSTSGVVLMFAMTDCSSPEPPTLIAMFLDPLEGEYPAAASTAHRILYRAIAVA